MQNRTLTSILPVISTHCIGLTLKIFNDADECFVEKKCIFLRKYIFFIFVNFMSNFIIVSFWICHFYYHGGGGTKYN